MDYLMTFKELVAIDPILEWFDFSHLRDGPMKDTSAKFYALAMDLVNYLPRSAERTVTLRKLLEAKDAAVRSAKALLI